ncbi:MAG: Crp/Fnr family transcriptional regulator [Deltaproteobacteria bacterium]|nr:Crp/Fnr family transcriptional regulator [Deltaproteobacteria bacterium]
MQEKPNPSLRSFAPFDLIPPEAMRKVARFSFEKDFRKGETIFVEGAFPKIVWFVKQGRVHLEKFHSKGKSSTVCVKATGDFLCCLPALDRKGYPAAAIAREQSRLVGIPFEVFSTLMAKWPEFCQRVIAVLCGCLREVEATRGPPAYESAEKRVVKTILILAEKFGPEIPLTRREIAELASLTVETTIRMTSRLKDKHLVTSDGRNPLRVDTEKLRAYLRSL